MRNPGKHPGGDGRLRLKFFHASGEAIPEALFRNSPTKAETGVDSRHPWVGSEHLMTATEEAIDKTVPFIMAIRAEPDSELEGPKQPYR